MQTHDVAGLHAILQITPLPFSFRFSTVSLLFPSSHLDLSSSLFLHSSCSHSSPRFTSYLFLCFCSFISISLSALLEVRCQHRANMHEHTQSDVPHHHRHLQSVLASHVCKENQITFVCPVIFSSKRCVQVCKCVCVCVCVCVIVFVFVYKYISVCNALFSQYVFAGMCPLNRCTSM